MRKIISTISLVLAAVNVLSSASVQAQTKAGPIRLVVDASQAPQKILHAHMVIPVTPGPLTLYYPEWIPGEHMPDGPIIEVAGLKFSSEGKTISWRRDLVEMFSIHLNVPAGVTTLTADFDFLLAAPTVGFSAGASATNALDVLSWNQVLMYPKGFNIRDITFVPSLKLPAGWKYGTALPGARQNGDMIDFSPVTLNTLVDSPVLAGKYFREIQLTPGQDSLHYIDIAADSEAALAMSPETQAHFRQLIAEAGALFGPRHYRDYHFLLTLSDDVAHFGLEHHESSDDRTSERSLIDDSELITFAGLLPHEFVHSWNGKYRRPEGLATADYQQPMKDDLLWVYEGLTEYLGSFVLTERSGLLTQQQTLDDLAELVATYEHRPGRDWRSLQDTADAAPFLYNSTEDWSNWRRGTDFYEEGQLLWLDIDGTLRGLTKDKKSMNDFCQLFYAGSPSVPALETYKFEDVVALLNSLAPYDWTGFLRAHLDGVATKTPLEAVENNGWKLIYSEEPNEMEAIESALAKRTNLTFTIGMIVQDDGIVDDVTHGGLAYDAGIGPGMKIIAVNGKQYSPDEMKQVIAGSKLSTAPIQLIVANGAQFQTLSIDYHGGSRGPHLVRDSSRPDYLGEILKPMVPAIGTAQATPTN